jgi:hypothetical protein
VHYVNLSIEFVRRNEVPHVIKFCLTRVDEHDILRDSFYQQILESDSVNPVLYREIADLTFQVHLYFLR